MNPDKSYTKNAKAIYEKLYLARNGNDEIIESIDNCHTRVANHLADSNEEFENFKRLLDEQKFRPNTPCMANAGIKDASYFACYVESISDNMDSIIEMWGDCARIFEGGGGVGIPITNLRRKGGNISHGGQACLTGDTILYRERPERTTAFQMCSIKEIYDQKKRFGYHSSPKKVRCVVDDNIIGSNNIEDIIYQGKAIAYEIKTKQGYKIKSTLNHRFFDKNMNEKRTDQFSVGDEITVNGKTVEKDTWRRYYGTCQRCGRYRKLRGAWSKRHGFCESCACNLSKDPNMPLKGSKENHLNRCLAMKEAHNREEAKEKSRLNNLGQKNPGWKGENANRTTARQRINYLYPELRNSACEKCGKTNTKIEIHHKDENPYNNSRDNLQALCCKCHQKLHAKKRRKQSNDPRKIREVMFDTIVEITYTGMEDVYDIVMAAPYHNFVANGFISHNSGPISYMNVIEEIGQQVKSGGKARRAALLLAMKYNHPDIIDLIHCKDDQESFQSMNLSVSTDNDFMDNVLTDDGKEYPSSVVKMYDPNEGYTGKTISVQGLWNYICKSAWGSGDPGLIFLDRVNEDNPLNHLELIESSNPCFPGYAKVWTIHGPKTFKELADKGKDVPVLSQNDEGFLEIKTMRNPRLSRRRKQNLVRVHFDDSRFEDCTPDHSWFVRTKDGIKKVQAKDLKPGDSISSVYRSNANQHKRKRLTNGIEDPLQHHVHVAWKEERRPEYPFEHCHHKDNDKTNDNPNNLEILPASEHNAMGMFGKDNPTCKYGSWLEGKGHLIAGSKNPHYYHHITKEMVVDLKNQGFTKKQMCEKLGCSEKVIDNRLQPNNHKITHIEHLPHKEFVYNGTVDDNHNFFIHIGDDDGVLVANCSEVVLPPTSTCCLGHLNLTKYNDFVEDSDFEDDVYWATLFLNKVIEKSPYPSVKFKEKMMKYRPIGLGIMGLADYFYQHRLKYGSNDSKDELGIICSQLTRLAYKASARLVSEGKISPIDFPDFQSVNQFIEMINKFGYECGKADIMPGNMYVSSIAPTGSCAISADCSYGFEPHFGLAWKKVLDGGETMDFLNDYFLDALYEAEGEHKNIYSQEELIELINENNGSIQDIKDIPQDIKDIFVVAHDIHWRDRIDIQSAAQENITMSISSTVNLPNSATIEDVSEVYKYAYEKRLKGITIYRDGCRSFQPVNFGGSEAKEEKENCFGENYKRPMERDGKIIEVNTPAGKLYVRGSFDCGKLMEVFLDVGEQGSRENVLFNGIGRLISRGLQKGLDLDSITDTLRGSGGDTFFMNLGNDKSHRVNGVLDAVATVLDEKFSSKTEQYEEQATQLAKEVQEESSNNYDRCPECKRFTLRRDGACRGGTCIVCGYSNCL